MTRHRRGIRLRTRWAERQRQAALDAAAAAQEAEREAARRRVLTQATELVAEVRPAPSWRPARRQAPARETPLLTLGQAARSRRTVQ